LERQTIENLEKKKECCNEWRGVANDYRFLLSICRVSMYLAHLEFRLIKCRKQVDLLPYSTRRKYFIPNFPIYFSRFMRASFILQLHDGGCKKMLRF